MDPSPDAATPTLPVACTLNASDGPGRMLRWQRLMESGRGVATRHGALLEVRFDAGAALTAELSTLAAAERECCAFLGWSIEVQADANVLRVTADAAGLDDVETVASLFGTT